MRRDQVFAYALTQPGAEDSTLHGGRCVRVRGHWIVNDSREPDCLALALDLGTVAFLIATEPRTYFQTTHFEGWPAVLVRHDVADDDRLREQIDKAWARRATYTQRKARGLLGGPLPFRFRHPPTSRAAAQIGGPSGAEGDLFKQGVRDSVALSRAAGSPGLAALAGG